MSTINKKMKFRVFVAYKWALFNYFSVYKISDNIHYLGVYCASNTVVKYSMKIDNDMMKH